MWSFFSELLHLLNLRFRFSPGNLDGDVFALEDPFSGDDADDEDGERGVDVSEWECILSKKKF